MQSQWHLAMQLQGPQQRLVVGFLAAGSELEPAAVVEPMPGPVVEPRPGLVTVLEPGLAVVEPAWLVDLAEIELGHP